MGDLAVIDVNARIEQLIAERRSQDWNDMLEHAAHTIEVLCKPPVVEPFDEISITQEFWDIGYRQGIRDAAEALRKLKR